MMKDAASVPTPELDKRSKVMNTPRRPTDLLTEFYDWLNEQGYVLAKWGEERETFSGSEPELFPDYVNPEQLFADFFGIDLKKIDAEQRALLEAIRS